ncbi:MAG: bifunctional DNA-formamidopyrimidine glycosylase/DNA-(apurinic or apyrimidinic site) lyase [Rickettsiales bacterium]|nr:bifunctional DNA-formamidopyrimidine glycosylase/DNA-(apurinic or apyrimidinic site) lyase [Rickettsiales bacterium]
MPELPEVETVCRGLQTALVSKRISQLELFRPDLRVPFTPNMAQCVQGRTFTSIVRRSKYLLMHMDGPDVILAHLGMSGSFTVRPLSNAAPQKHEHVKFTLNDGHEMIYHDPRRFGLMLLIPAAGLDAHPLLSVLGPEPLEAGFHAKYLATALSRRSGPIKPALMDASVVVGVGNIYASEALFRCGLHPSTPAKNCILQAASLVKNIRSVLQEAIASGGSTLKDYTSVDGMSGYFQHHFSVYGKAGKPCEICGSAIEKIVQGGRSSFFCPSCQRLKHD